MKHHIALMNANGSSIGIRDSSSISSFSRSRKMLENQLNLGTDRTESLETQLKEARTLAAESDKKFDEVSCSKNCHSILLLFR